MAPVLRCLPGKPSNGNHSPGGNEATWSLGQVKPWSLGDYEASKVFNLLKGILIRFQRYPERYNLGRIIIEEAK